MGGKTSDWKRSNIWNEARLPNKGCLFRKNQTLPQQNLGGSFFSIEIMWNQHPLAVQKRTTKNILVRMFRENGFPFHDLGTIPLHTAGSLAIDLGGSAWILFMLSFSYFCLFFISCLLRFIIVCVISSLVIFHLDIHCLWNCHLCVNLWCWWPPSFFQFWCWWSICFFHFSPGLWHHVGLCHVAHMTGKQQII